MELIYILLVIIVLLLAFIILKQFYPNILNRIKRSFSDSKTDEEDDDIISNIIVGIFIICMGIFTLYNFLN